MELSSFLHFPFSLAQVIALFVPLIVLLPPLCSQGLLGISSQYLNVRPLDWQTREEISWGKNILEHSKPLPHYCQRSNMNASILSPGVELNLRDTLFCNTYIRDIIHQIYEQVFVPKVDFISRESNNITVSQQRK